MSGVSPGGGRLAGRIAVVTGASSGNGRAIALALAAEGAAVVNGDLNPSARSDGFEEDKHIDTDVLIRDRGGRALFQRLDVTSEDDMAAVADRAIAEFGRIDLWVNNAGIGQGFGPIPGNALADLQATIGVNVIGTWLGCRTAVDRMKDQPIAGRARGRIINIGSLAGHVGQPGASIYSTTKGAVHALTVQLAVECAPLGINVNALAPGYLPTAMNRELLEDEAGRQRVKDLHPWFDSPVLADVAGPVVFLASEEAAFVTGVVLPVDGGAFAK